MPVNSIAKVFIPTFGLTNVTIFEGEVKLWEDGRVVGTGEIERATEICFYGLDGVFPSSNNYVIFAIGSGTYDFTTA